MRNLIIRVFSLSYNVNLILNWYRMLYFSRKNVEVYLYFAILLLPWSPVVSWALGIDSKIIFTILLLFFFINSKSKFVINKFTLIFILSFLSVSILVSIVGNKPQLFLSLLGFPLSIIVTQHIFRDKDNIDKLVSLLTYFSFFALFMSIIGFIYSINGGVPITTITNFDGRENALYLTTFSNSNIGGIIRPSFIYDEPGALAFVLIFTVAAREILGRSKNISSLLLALGLITFSLTMTLVLLLYVCVNLRSLTGIKIGSILLIIVVSLFLNTEIFKPFIDRVQSFANGDSNNRTSQIDNFIENVKIEDVILVGVNDCSDLNQCNLKYGDISSNPLSVIFGKGFIGLLIQVWMYSLLFVALFRYKFLFSAGAMIILISQRPFITAIGYSTMIIFIIYYMYFTKYKKDDKYQNGY